MKTVELLEVGYVGLSSQAIRMNLEYHHAYRVNMHYISTARQLITALSNIQPENIVVIDGHGTEEGLVLDTLGEEYAMQEPFNNHASPARFTSFLKLPPCPVISLACCLGEKPYADAFLNAGASHYIGALGYPDGSSALIYAQFLFYLMHNQNLPLEEAHEKARGIDEATKLFTLYKHLP
jgi:hypothetical protein